LKPGCKFCAEVLIKKLGEFGNLNYIESTSGLKKKLIIGGAVAGGAVVGACALPVALPLLGFTSAGVAAGSIAASIQSVVYGGFTTGLFSLAQSAGAVGVSAATTAGMAAAGGAAGVGAAKAAESADDQKQKEENIKRNKSCTCTIQSVRNSSYCSFCCGSNI